jgi:Flp pilus assembly protein TadB
VIKCPHCGALAAVEPSVALRWRCTVCGGPVVPTDDDVARSNGELADLVRSHRARAMALGWMAGALVLCAIALMALGVALLAWFASHVTALLLVAIAGAAATLALISGRRSKRRRDEAREQLDQAWEHVAGEVLAARGGDTTAADLARVMRTDVGQAETLLGRLSASGRARVDVREDADLAYRVSNDAGPADGKVASGAAPRVRAR